MTHEFHVKSCGEQEPCPNSARSMWLHGPAQEEHACPFREDVHNDSETKCHCCERCMHECAMDV